MRSGIVVGGAALLIAASASLGSATGIPVARPVPMGERALEARIKRNPEIAIYVARRGYPDWAEEVEVDNQRPLDASEVRLYYLRLDKEVGFTRAFILGRPMIGLRTHERPLSPAMRERILQAYLAHDPACRAELAAARAEAAAERVESAADSVSDSADRAERIAEQAERAFHARLRK
jgi:hypothetical protein